MLKLALNNKIYSITKLVVHTQVPLYRNAYALMLSTVGTAGFGLIYWVLAARYYTPETVGRDAAMISGMIFLADIAQLNLMSVMIRFIPRSGRATGRLIGYGYLISMTVAAVVSFIAIFFGNRSPFLGFVDTSLLFNLSFMFATIATCISLLQDGVLNGLGQSIWVPIENIGFAVAKIVLLIIFATALPQHGIFASWTIPMIVILLPINYLIFFRLIPRHVQATEDQAEPIIIRQVTGYLAANYLGTLVSQAAVRLLPLVVAYRAGPDANAYFYLPWIIVLALKLISANMVTSLTVEGSKKQVNFDAQGYRFLIHMAQLTIPMIVIFFLGAPYLLRLSGTNYAVEGTTLLRLLAISTLPNVIITFYIGIARIQNRVMGIVLVQALNSILVLGLSYILLPLYGLTGIGIASLVSETLVAIVVMPHILKLRGAKKSAAVE